VAQREISARGSATAQGRVARQPARGRHPLLLPSLLALGAGVVGVAVLALTIGLTQTGRPIQQPAHKVPAGLASARALGSDDAPVTIEIWSDFQCPACGMLARELEPRLITDYVVPGTVRLVYRDLAFLGEESVMAATGGRFAADAGRFWEYHDLVFANQRGENEGAFNRDRLSAIAVAAGLDQAAFGRALVRPAFRTEVLEETAEGRSLGITSTPTLVINGTAYRGVPDYDSLSALVDQLAAS
jgi:protein-disulfide isomerase